MAKHMEWHGKTLATYGELFQGLQTLTTTEEAAEFYRLYREVVMSWDDTQGKTDEEINAIVSSNLGYLLGYGDEDDRLRIQALFEGDSVVHPISGGRSVTFTEALAMGAFVGGVRAQEGK